MKVKYRKGAIISIIHKRSTNPVGTLTEGRIYEIDFIKVCPKFIHYTLMGVEGKFDSLNFEVMEA